MFKDFIFRLPRLFTDSFRGWNFFWHLLAIGLTAVLVLSGFDWWYFSVTRGSVYLQLALPAAIIGFFVPVLLPVLLYWLGMNGKRPRFMLAAIATAQAGILGWCISSLYKAFTGRIQPEFMTYTSNIDISRDFNFGFLQHGIFWGWPSSHTAVAFAMSVALICMFPRKRLLSYGALLYALFIGLSVSISIHWFSDFLAGAILGSLVGIIVGRSFLKNLNSR